MRASFAACTLLVASVLAISEINYWRGRADIAEMSQRLDTQRRLQALLTAMVDAETAQRGYMLTGDERYLQSYRASGEASARLLDELRTQYRRDGEALDSYGEVSRAASAKLTELDLTIRLRRGGQLASAADVLSTQIGREKMDAVRGGIAQLMDHEAGRRRDVAQRWERMRQASRNGIALMSTMVMVACFLVLRQNAKAARERDAQRRELQAERDALDATVARRTEDLERLASHLQNSREDERAKLARELHDELGAVLTAAKLDVAWLGAKLKGHDVALLERLRALKSVLEDAIELKRRIIEDLRPSLLTNLGLVPALERLVEDHRQRFDGTVRAAIEPDIEVCEDIALVVYRIAQEALTNVQKYARASTVEVTLRQLPRHLELRVSDDGVGFEASGVGAACHGLAGMRHRLLSIRGTLDVDTAPGRGTVITANVPRVRDDDSHRQDAPCARTAAVEAPACRPARSAGACEELPA